MKPYQPPNRPEALDEDQPLDGLGRKGTTTRGRLMEAARRLLTERSAIGLTSAAIAQGAGVSAASFYNYFVNTEAIIHALCLEAGAETQPIRDAVTPRDGDDARTISGRFITAYADHWSRFRPVLSVRNMEAERGNIAFQLLRRSFFHAMIDILLDAALTLRPVDGDAEIEARSGRIAVAVAAIERLGPAEGLYLDEPNPYRRFAPDLLAAAQIDLLAAALGGDANGGRDD